MQHAREMFSAIVATGENMGSLSEEQRKDTFRVVAKITLEAAFVFQEVANEMVDKG